MSGGEVWHRPRRCLEEGPLGPTIAYLSAAAAAAQDQSGRLVRAWSDGGAIPIARDERAKWSSGTLRLLSGAGDGGSQRLRVLLPTSVATTPSYSRHVSQPLFRRLAGEPGLLFRQARRVL